MMSTPQTIIDVDQLLTIAAPPIPVEPPVPTVSPEQHNLSTEPTLLQRLRDELVAKARLIGWSDSELVRLSRCESEADLFADRERIGRELSLRFAVPPLYSSQPLASPAGILDVRHYR